jgi:hypothetical protein
MTITVSGTTLTFNDSTTMTTAATGTVTSVATGNGLSGGTITTSGTLVIACPSFNSVGSYVYALITQTGGNVTYTTGQNLSAGTGQSQVQTFFAPNNVRTNNLSGTWRYLNGTGSFNLPPGCVDTIPTLACRVS